MPEHPDTVTGPWTLGVQHCVKIVSLDKPKTGGAELFQGPRDSPTLSAGTRWTGRKARVFLKKVHGLGTQVSKLTTCLSSKTIAMLTKIMFKWIERQVSTLTAYF
eukprot:scaffold217927_cov19-Tisochrysis_lutea.AAC.1